MIIIINISTMKIEIEIKNCLKLYKIKKKILKKLIKKHLNNLKLRLNKIKKVIQKI